MCYSELISSEFHRWYKILLCDKMIVRWDSFGALAYYYPKEVCIMQDKSLNIVFVLELVAALATAASGVIAKHYITAA